MRKTFHGRLERDRDRDVTAPKTYAENH